MAPLFVKGLSIIIKFIITLLITHVFCIIIN